MDKEHIRLIDKKNLEGLTSTGLNEKDFKNWNKKMANKKTKIYLGEFTNEMAEEFFYGMQAFYLDFKLSGKDTRDLIRIFNIYRDNLASNNEEFLDIYYSVGKENLQKSIKYREKIKNAN